MRITKKNLIKIIKEAMSQEYIDKGKEYEQIELAKGKSDRKAFSRAFKKAHVEEINKYDLSKFVGLHIVSAFTGISTRIGGKDYKSGIPDGISYLAKNLNIKNPAEQSVYIKRKNDMNSIISNAIKTGFSVILQGHWTGMYKDDAMTDMGRGPNTRKYYGGRATGARFMDTERYSYSDEELANNSYNTESDEGVIAGAEIIGIIFSSKYLIAQINLFNGGYIDEYRFKQLRKETDTLIVKLQSFSGDIIDIEGVIKNANDLNKILSSLNESWTISPEEKQKAIDEEQRKKKEEEELEIYSRKYNKIEQIIDNVENTLKHEKPTRSGKEFYLYNNTTKTQLQNMMSPDEIFSIIIDDIYSDYFVWPINEGMWKDWTAIPEIAVLAQGKIEYPR